MVPQVSIAGLQGLHAALLRNDVQLTQGSTTYPPSLQCVEREPVASCCPLCWLLLDGRKPHDVSVGLLEERFTLACRRADELLGEPGPIRHFLNAVDEWSRDE